MTEITVSQKVKKLALIVLIVVGTLFFGRVAYAATCDLNECERQEKYTCESGTMCCTGGGCPSWVCNQQGKAFYWNNPAQKCCYNVVESVPKTCYKWVNDKPCLNYVCLDWDCLKWENKQICDDPGPFGVSDERSGDVLGCHYVWICKRWGCVWGWCSKWTRKKVPYTCWKDKIVAKCNDPNVQPSPYDTCDRCRGEEENGGCTWGAWSACSVSCGGGTQFRVDTCGTFDIRDCNEQVCVDEVNIRGYIWNATGQACTNNPDSGLEIVKGSADGDVAEDITVTLDGTTSGTWDPEGFGGYSYNFSAIEVGDHVITANVPDPVGYPNSRYRLACVNEEKVGVAAVNAQADPATVHLGYNISSVGWFQSIDGDIYGGCDEANCANSVSVSIPTAGEVMGGFKSYLVAGIGTLFGDSGLSIANDSYSEDDNRRLEFMASEAFWPETFTFTPPSSANELSDCNDIFGGNKLTGGEVYKGSVSCVQDGLDSLSGNYNFVEDGVAVIYVTGTDTLTFNKAFTASNDRRRVLFITEGPVEYSADIGDAAPTSGKSPDIEASVISEQIITFLSKSTAEPDTTIIVEGPLVTKEGAINFNRDRGLANDYPAHVVKYNSLYLVSSTDAVLPGVSTVDISWVIGE